VEQRAGHLKKSRKIEGFLLEIFGPSNQILKKTTKKAGKRKSHSSSGRMWNRKDKMDVFPR